MSRQLGAETVDILLVEDNDADIYLFRQALIGAGLDFDLTVIEDGYEALSFVRSEREYAQRPIPDLAVLDLNLPKLGGIEILEALRGNHQLKEVPVLIMSSSASPRERARAMELRVERFITKPPDLEDFLQLGYLVKEILAKQDGNAR